MVPSPFTTEWSKTKTMHKFEVTVITLVDVQANSAKEAEEFVSAMIAKTTLSTVVSSHARSTETEKLSHKEIDSKVREQHHKHGKNNAIKLYRDLTGCSLSEAFKYVENL